MSPQNQSRPSGCSGCGWGMFTPADSTTSSLVFCRSGVGSADTSQQRPGLVPCTQCRPVPDETDDCSHQKTSGGSSEGARTVPCRAPMLQTTVFDWQFNTYSSHTVDVCKVVQYPGSEVRVHSSVPACPSVVWAGWC